MNFLTVLTVTVMSVSVDPGQDINAAIQSVNEQGGGTVVLNPGVHESYSIHLCDNLTLQLSEGAVLKAAKPEADRGYDLPEDNTYHMYQDHGHSHWHNSLIWGESVSNVRIVGKGLIDGRNLKRFTSSRRNPNMPQVNDANKAIAIKRGKNITLEGFDMLECGHFALLATDVEGLTIRDMRIDTNRDALDIDGCRNVLVEGCQVNSPWDDAIVLKSCYSLGYFADVENVIVRNCVVSGYDCGTLLDGTRQLVGELAPDGGGRTGRIKIGTETSGSFRNVLVEDCHFEHCRGLALETVDGGTVENVIVRNITMEHIVNAAIFMRIGARLRSPEGTPVGKMRNIRIENVKAKDVDSRYSSIIAGIPGHPVEDVVLKDIDIQYQGGCVYTDRMMRTDQREGVYKGQRDSVLAVNPNEPVPEADKGYPEPWIFGVVPAKGIYIRHARNIKEENVRFSYEKPDVRPERVTEDLQ